MGEARLDLGGIEVLALDGGAMSFTIERRDRRLEIELSVRPLLVRGAGWSCVVDTGFGPADPERRRKFRLRDPEPLEQQCARAGVAEPDLVLLTHLHFDHAGGSLAAGPAAGEALRFPDSRVAVHAAEWRASLADRRGGDMAERIGAAIGAAPDFLVDGDEPFPGLAVEHVPGHTEGLCLVWLMGRDRTLLIGTDLIPTRRFLEPRLDTVADLEPEVALAARRRTLARAAEEGAWVAFYHDPECAFGAVVRLGPGRFALENGTP